MSSIQRISARGSRLWHIVDAKNQVLGRLTSQIAHLLMGKHKPTFTPSVDSGDYVVILNARDVALTGKKRTAKLYQWHTGWMGGLKTLTARQMFEKDSRRVVSLAVKGMLPPNQLRRVRMERLKVFPGDVHEFAAQVAESRAYAGEHLKAVAPKSVQPREVPVGGALVKDASAEYSPEELAELEKDLVQLQHDPAFMDKYNAWRKDKLQQAQEVQDAVDREIVEGLVEADKKAASAAGGAAGVAGAKAGGKGQGKERELR